MPSLNLALVGGERYPFPKLASREEILALFDKNVATARKAISDVKDENVSQPLDALDGRAARSLLKRKRRWSGGWS